MTRFKRAIGPFLTDCRRFDLRVIAERGRDNSWVLNSLRAVLEHQPSSQVPLPDLPDVPDLLVLHEQRGADRLFELIDMLARGKFALGEVEISLMRPNTSPPEPSFYMRKRTRDATLAEFGIDSASFVLTAGDSLGSRLPEAEFRTVDDALSAQAAPWDGLTDLRRNFMGIPEDQASRNEWSSVEVVAPLGVVLSQTSRLQENRIEAMVTAFPGVDLSALGASVVAYLPSGRIFRKQARFNMETTTAPGEFRAVIELPELPSLASLVLNYRGIRADRMDLRGKALLAKNPRLAVLERIAGGLEALQEGLEKARSRGRDIEGWIAFIFSLLDFSPSHYGSTPWEVPDILAFAKAGQWLLVIECTEREPDLGGKLTKLATRTKEIGLAAGMRAYPVIVTALERSILNKTDLEKASKEAVAIVSADEYPDLLRLVLKSATADETRNFLERLIPSQDFTSTYWIRGP